MKRLVVALVLALASACSDPEVSTDAGTSPRDATIDAPTSEPIDASHAADGGSPLDASIATDAGAPTDLPCAPGGRHLSALGAGSQDGSSEANAAPIESLAAMLEAAGPGGEVCLHEGVYPAGMRITHGGDEGAPLTIRGIGRVIIRSTFDPTTRARSGPVAFTMRASHVVVRDLELENVGTCFAFPDDVDSADILLERFRASGVATCVDVQRYGEQVVDGLTIRGAMILRFTRGGIFLGGRARNVSIEDCYIDMQPDTIGGRGVDYPVGIALYDEIQHVEISGTTVLDVVGMTEGYSQGDGIDGERSASDILLRDSFFAGSQDGCVDTKTTRMVVQDTVAVGCKRNFRLWQSAEGPRCERCTSYEPRDSHLFVHGGEGVARDVTVYNSEPRRLVTTDDDSTFVVDGLAGSVAAEADLNARVITRSTVEIGAAFDVPAAPNPTRFTP